MIDRHLVNVYGSAAPLWRNRWRLFFSRRQVFSARTEARSGASAISCSAPQKNEGRQRKNDAQKYPISAETEVRNDPQIRSTIVTAELHSRSVA